MPCLCRIHTGGDGSACAASTKSLGVWDYLVGLLWLVVESVLIGGFLLVVSFVKDSWLITLLPTSLAATAYWYVMQLLTIWPNVKFRSRFYWAAVNIRK